MASRRLLYAHCILVIGFIFSVYGTRAQAVTRITFPPNGTQVMVFIQGLSAGQPNDPDPVKLFALLNVEESQVPGGTGKGIKTDDGALNLSCVERPSLPEAVMCSLVIKSSTNSTISPSEKKAVYLVKGPEASRLHQQFHHDTDGEVHFSNTPGSVKIHSNGNEFSVTVEQN